MTPAIPINPKPSKLAKAHLMLSFIPWINLVYFWSYAFYVRYQLGHWPKPMVESPIIPYDNLLSDITGCLFLATLASVPLWLLFFLVGAVRGETKHFYKAGLVFSLALTVSVALCVADPGGFVAWWID